MFVSASERCNKAPRKPTIQFMTGLEPVKLQMEDQSRFVRATIRGCSTQSKIALHREPKLWRETYGPDWSYSIPDPTEF